MGADLVDGLGGREEYASPTLGRPTKVIRRSHMFTFGAEQTGHVNHFFGLWLALGPERAGMS